MASLSQALRLEYLPSSHSAFQGHAAHIIEWPMMLRPKDSEGTCIPSGVTTFLQTASRRSPSSDYYALTVAACDIGVSLGSPLPTLHSPSHSHAVSRVQHRRLSRDVVGGVLCVPLPLFVAPSSLHRVASGFPVFPRTHEYGLH